MLSAHANEIPLEGWTELTEEYVELARIWVSSTRSFVLIAPEAATTPALLGSLLVESAYTAAQTYASGGTMSVAEALTEILRGIDEERARLSEEDT